MTSPVPIKVVTTELFASHKLVYVKRKPFDRKSRLDRGDSRSLKNSKYNQKTINTYYRETQNAQTNHNRKSNLSIEERKYELTNLTKKGTARFRCNDGTFRVHRIFGDGNCMFRAISYILWRNENEHRILRSSVAQHISENWHEYSPHVIAEWDITNPREYYNFMNSVGTFASELECIVATKIYHMNLAIYREVGSRDELKLVLYNRVNYAYETARLLFTGLSESGHYDVLLSESQII